MTLNQKLLKLSLLPLIFAILAVLTTNNPFTEKVFAAPPPPASNTTAPYQVTYTAKLTNNAGNPITTPQTVRFSLWKDADWMNTDFDPLGDIDITAPNYVGWQETHTVTPNAEGIFSVYLGSQNVFPNFTSSTHLFLEVDIKPSTAPNTAFEVLDTTGNLADNNDRKLFNSVPYAINADTVDNRDASNTPNNIPVLDGSGKLIYGVLPDGVNANTFTLDMDNNAPANIITLQFGNALGEYLRFNNPLNRFEFSKSLNINGDLTFTGTANIYGATIDGTMNNIINILPTSILPTHREIRLTPEYPNTALHPSGIDNNGRLLSSVEDYLGEKYHYYQWTTGKATEQTMNMKVRYQLPEGFVGFTPNPIRLYFNTADNNNLNNRIDLTMTDSVGTVVSLNNSLGLTSSLWNFSDITFNGMPTFTPNTYIEFDIQLSSVNGGKFARVGDLILNYQSR